MRLSVRDNGQGIAPSFLPHVFDWFRQADGAMNRRAQGLGLGLAIVKKLVSLHGGSIVAESRGEGLGATFSIELPVAAASRQSAAPSGSDATHTGGVLDGIRILVVEDEDDSRELVGVLLEEAGAIVTKVADAKTALALVGTSRVDLIVSDIGMPGMDGLQFVRDLRTRSVERGGQTPAIALTAYTRAQDRPRRSGPASRSCSRSPSRWTRSSRVR